MNYLCSRSFRYAINKKIIMKKINELWDEIIDHADYVTGRLWTIKVAASYFECELTNYLVDELNLEGIDESDIVKYSLDIVKQNIKTFKNTIDEFELYSYSYGCNWETDIDQLNLPEFEANVIV